MKLKINKVHQSDPSHKQNKNSVIWKGIGNIFIIQELNLPQLQCLYLFLHYLVDLTLDIVFLASLLIMFPITI